MLINTAETVARGIGKLKPSELELNNKARATVVIKKAEIVLSQWRVLSCIEYAAVIQIIINAIVCKAKPEQLNIVLISS